VKQSYLAHRVAALKPSGIRKFFDIVATMKDVISLGIGEPDFVTPDPILRAGIASLQSGETHYTSNLGVMELRQQVARPLDRARDELREERHEGEEGHDVAGRPQLPAVDIEGVAERLESVEADADREDDLQAAHVGPHPEHAQQVGGRVHEEAVVLEDREDAEVAYDADREEDLACA